MILSLFCVPFPENLEYFIGIKDAVVDFEKQALDARIFVVAAFEPDELLFAVLGAIRPEVGVKTKRDC